MAGGHLSGRGGYVADATSALAGELLLEKQNMFKYCIYHF